MTTVWNLSRLRYEVRKITGKLDASQIPDSSNSLLPISASNPPGIDDYINDFYLYDFDEELRTLELKNFYVFQTIPNLGTYSLPPGLFFEAETPIYVDGYQIAWYQNPDIFFRIWPQLSFIQNQIATTDGTSTSYTFTLSSTPIQQGTLSIGTTPVQNMAVESFSDPQPVDVFVNPENLLSTNAANVAPGTIDYITGAVTINYETPPPAGLSINAHYYPYVASRPRDCLFFHQQFNFKPIPNDVYQIKVLAYQQPTTVLAGGGSGTQFQNGTDTAIFNEWWQVIAYGAALKIFVDDSDHEQYQANLVYFERAKLNAQRRALKQLSNQRIQTPYSENASGNSWTIFPFY